MNYEELTNVFEINQESKSNLAWKITIKCGYKNNRTKIRKGDHCLSINKTNNRYSVYYKGKNYSVSRIVYCLHYKCNLIRSDIIDHFDGNPFNNDISNLRKVCSKLNSRNVKNRTDRIKGISFIKINGFEYWTARWTDLNGRNFSKQYSVQKLGFQFAYGLALTCRHNKMQELNKLGAGYTERHLS